MALLGVLAPITTTDAQYLHDPISHGHHDEHCWLLDLTSGEQKQRARSAFARYQIEWNAIVDMQRAILDWQRGIQPTTWRGWDESLTLRYQVLFPRSEAAAADAYALAHDGYFRKLLTAAPWADDMVTLLAQRRARSRFEVFYLRAYLYDVRLIELIGCDPFATLLDLDIPVRRGTRLWKLMIEHSREVEPLHEMLGEAARVAARSPEMERARTALLRAAETKPIEDSRAEIDAIARLRVAPVPFALQLRRTVLGRLEEFAEAISIESDRHRFRDRIMRDAYPMLLGEGRDVTQIAAIIRQQHHDLSAEQQQALDSIVTDFRAERDRSCAAIEALVAKSFDKDRLLGVMRIFAGRQWNRGRVPDMDPPPLADFVKRWDERLSAWRERVEAEVGVAAPAGVRSGPVTERTEEDRREFFDDYLVAGRWWPDRTRNVIQPDAFREIADALPFDDTTRETIDALTDGYADDLQKWRQAAWQRFSALSGRIDANSVGPFLDWYARRYTREQDLIVTLRTVIPDPARSEFVSQVYRARRDVLLSSRGRYEESRWRYDLLPLARNVAVDSWELIAPILDEYAAQMDDAIRAWSHANLLVGRELNAIQAEQPRDDEWSARFTALVERGDRLNRIIDDLNNQYAARIAGLLTADEAWRFEYAVNAAQYPLLGNPVAVFQVIDHLLATDGTLNNVQRAQLTELRDSFERQFAALLDAFIDHQAFWDSPDQLEKWTERRTELGSRDRTTQRVNIFEAGAGHPGMATLEQMLDLVIDTMAEIRRIIGADVFANLPPAIRFCFLCYESPRSN